MRTRVGLFSVTLATSIVFAAASGAYALSGSGGGHGPAPCARSVDRHANTDQVSDARIRLLVKLEPQTFDCSTCDSEMERSAYNDGKPNPS